MSLKSSLFSKKWFKVGLFTLLIVLISLPGIYELLKPGYYSNHDGEGHIIRLQEYDIAIKDGHFPPRISKNLMYGYGYYFFNFNYPLVYWMGEAAHLVGFGYVDAVKVVSILGVVLSGIAMFTWQYRYWGFLGGFVSSVLYMYAPYRLLTLYVRGALAEHIAYIMLPLLFLFTERIAEGRKRKRSSYVLLGAISYALLMLSHNITAFIFSLMLGLFMLFHMVLKKRLRLIVDYALMIFLGMAMSAFFWYPALSEKGFVLLDQTIGQDYPDHFIHIQQLFQRTWGYGGSGVGLNDGLSFQVGIFAWLFLLLGIPAAYILWKKSHAKSLHIIFYIFLFFLSVFFMLPTSRVLWDNLPLLPFTQFPWRFLSWSIFTTSIIGGMVVYAIQRKFRSKKKMVYVGVAIVLAGLLISNSEYLKVNERVEIKLPGDNPIQGSTTWADEQFPRWFDPKPTEVPDQHVEIVEGNGSVSVDNWLTSRHTYKVVANDWIKIVENTAYYPGWSVFVNDEKIDFSYEDSEYPGRIVYLLDEGNYKIQSVFMETKTRQIANLVSVTMLLIVIGFLGYYRVVAKR